MNNLTTENMKRVVLVYKNNYCNNGNNCNNTKSIGQTGRTFKDRYKEHIKAVININHSNYTDSSIDEK